METNLLKEISDVGAIAILFLLFIREFFAYLKSKKGTNGNGDSEQKKSIENMREICDLKHAGIDTSIHDIKENHLKHIEQNIKDLELNYREIKTILNERLPQKPL